jgi:anti-anti-sigma factor
VDDFSVRAKVEGTIVMAAVEGDIDLAAAEHLLNAVAPLIQPGRDIVIDCAGIRFLDSTGLRTLLDLDRRTTEAGGRLTLTEVPPPVSRILDLAGVTGAFRIHGESPDAGVA